MLDATATDVLATAPTASPSCCAPAASTALSDWPEGPAQFSALDRCHQYFLRNDMACGNGLLRLIMRNFRET